MHTDLLAELDALPLLGRGLERAVALCGDLAAQVAEARDDRTERRLLARGAEIAFVQESPQATELLADAARAAAEAGETEEALRLGLLVCRALASYRQAEAARDRLAALMDDVLAVRSLRPDLRLAAAACGLGHVLGHLDAALTLLPSPARDHDRLSTHLDLAERLHTGGDLYRAREHLRAALALTETHGDHVGACHVSAMHGNLLVEVGLASEAVSHLRRALDLALDLGDTLTVVAEGTVLAAIHLEAGDVAAARAVAAEVRIAAERRHNWLACADATLTAASCSYIEGDLEDAVRTLVVTATRLQRAGAVGATNLVKARLGELRVQVGEETFDPVLRGVVEGLKT